MRLDKFLAQAGVGKRKEVREWIKEGLVKVDEKIVTEPALEINELKDNINLKGESVVFVPPIYIMLNKPKGCVTAKSDKEHKTVFEYLDKEKIQGLFHVGRLDKDTEGLLLFTNDGEFEHRLMSPQKHMTKRYFFWALGELGSDKCKKIEEGIYINKGTIKAKPGKIKVLQEGVFEEFEEEIANLIGEKIPKGRLRQKVVSGEITITEGKKHQVKKMLKAIGCHVIYLKRVAVGKLELPLDLKSGECRELTEDELSYFK